MKKNILILMGGGGSEHEISLVSASYIESQIDKNLFTTYLVEIKKDFSWSLNGENCFLNFNKQLELSDRKIEIDAAIPCIHGTPGETGEIQSLFKLTGLNYFGCESESSVLCFNKLTTKLMLELAGVATTPFIQVKNTIELEDAKAFIAKHGECYLKATNQGSSVGCYFIKKFTEFESHVNEAFHYSPFVILEKSIQEVSAFEYKDELIVTLPGEIISPSKFYSYEEKYSANSKTKTMAVADNISENALDKIAYYSKLAFHQLKLRHLSRIDFFLTEDDEVYINEINTFPGHTEISMFPKMMEAYGVKYSDYMNYHLQKLTQK